MSQRYVSKHTISFCRLLASFRKQMARFSQVSAATFKSIAFVSFDKIREDITSYLATFFSYLPLHKSVVLIVNLHRKTKAIYMYTCTYNFIYFLYTAHPFLHLPSYLNLYYYSINFNIVEIK